MKHKDRGHSLLSPSNAHRWMICAPSARLEDTYPDEPSEFALEGTHAHEWAQYYLLGGEKPEAYLDPDMETHARNYAAFICEIVKALKEEDANVKVYVEKAIDLSEFIPDGNGYVDAAIVSADTLFVVDFKYGAGVEVSAYQNAQMMCYALGILNENPHAKVVNMTIYQPRRDNVSNWQISAEGLREWAKDVLKPAAEKAFRGEGEFVTGEHCQFCRARTDCRARAGKAIELSTRDLTTVSAEEKRELVQYIPEMIKWLQAVMDEAESAAIFEGVEFPNMELYTTNSRRIITDADMVIKRLKADGHPELVRESPATISEMEKTYGKKEFAEIFADALGKTTPGQHLRRKASLTPKK